MAESPANPPREAQRKGTDTRKRVLFDKTMATTANLANLLPSGTTLAFQTLAPSFTNHGKCFGVNRVFSWGLIGFLCSACALLCFTDSITTADGKTYYGLALLTKKGFRVFNYDNEGPDEDFNEECKKRRVRPQDFLHAFFSALVFLSLAFDDNDMQVCLLQIKLTEPWKEFLVNMPLATGFLASVVFMIFPTTRKGIGYDAAAAADSPSTSEPDKNKPDQDAAAHASSTAVQRNELAPRSLEITDVAQVAPSAAAHASSTAAQRNELAPKSLEITDVARVAPSASRYELDSVV